MFFLNIRLFLGCKKFFPRKISWYPSQSIIVFLKIIMMLKKNDRDDFPRKQWCFLKSHFLQIKNSLFTLKNYLKIEKKVFPFLQNKYFILKFKKSFCINKQTKHFLNSSKLKKKNSLHTKRKQNRSIWKSSTSAQQHIQKQPHPQANIRKSEKG